MIVCPCSLERFDQLERLEDAVLGWTGWNSPFVEAWAKRDDQPDLKALGIAILEARKARMDRKRIDLHRFPACSHATKWFDEYDFPSDEATWCACERADWLIWISAIVEVDRKLITKCLLRILGEIRNLLYQYPQDTNAFEMIGRIAAWVDSEIEYTPNLSLLSYHSPQGLLHYPSHRQQDARQHVIGAINNIIGFVKNESSVCNSCYNASYVVNDATAAILIFKDSGWSDLIRRPVDVGLADIVKSMIPFDAVLEKARAWKET